MVWVEPIPTWTITTCTAHTCKLVCMVQVYCLFYLSKAPIKRARQQIQSRLIVCPPPRKSLVKGERFIRSEGRPEWNDDECPSCPLYTNIWRTLLVGCKMECTVNLKPIMNIISTSCCLICRSSKRLGSWGEARWTSRQSQRAWETQLHSQE